MNKRKYMEVTVFVGADNPGQNICVRNETLDGERGMVKLFIQALHKDRPDQEIGYFNIEDLIAAIRTAANADIPYLEEQMKDDKRNNKSEF